MQSHRDTSSSAHSKSPASGPGWAPPRAPLPPHRLAKLANALGVSTPLPMMTSSAPSLSLSQSHLGGSPSASNTDLPWRSVTPSTTSALNLVSQVQSKFLLHIIPPMHINHEADSDSSELVPPPYTASGYHTQFRRGTLVALQSTLQAQLVVIAREYALPSTMGIVLYLVSASPQNGDNSPMHYPSPTFCDAGGGEPGPRLSEEIWKHIWSRVLRAERDEVIALSRSGTPNPLGLGLSVGPNGPSQSLRPLVTTPTRTEQPRPLAYPITPSSTSTGSSISDNRSHDKSAGASSSHSEPDTPDTSPSSDHGLPSIELPGLNSASIIPILAKVEFDIDRRNASWYEPWVRSRRMKRTESRSSHRSVSRTRTLDSSNSTDEKRAPHDLKLVQRMQKPPFLRSQEDSDDGEQLEDGGYALLSESSNPDPATSMTSTMNHDSLGDVFGTDAETWTEIRTESVGVRRKVNNPNVVELALDATSLATLPEQGQEEDAAANDVDEVRDIIRRMSRPPLSVTIPNSSECKRKSSSSTTSGRRPTPSPLVLVPKSPTNSVIEGTTDSADFRNKEGVSQELEQEYQRLRSYSEEKRVGTVFEDLDLGLDLGDDEEEVYDENDPNDRRRSQYLLKAKLDEIERTLAQFSPSVLKTTMPDEDLTVSHHRNVSDASQLPTPSTPDPSAGPLHKAWPTIPYSSVTNAVNGSPPRPANLPPFPPILALNGVSTNAPKAFKPASGPSSAAPTESQARRLDLEPGMYPAMIPSPSRQVNAASDSPIPLYWDPVAQQFSNEPPPSRPVSSTDEGPEALTSAPLSSRFSADSCGFVDDNVTKSTAPIVSVRSLRKLWRRSKSSSGVPPQPQTPGRTSFQISNSPYPSTPTDQLTAPALPNPITRGSSGKSQLQFDDTYSSLPSSSVSGSRPTSPAVLVNASPQEKSGVRKSILRSWKTVAGAMSQQPPNGSEPRRSSERPVSNETIKARRPSALDDSIPPTPQLPQQYLPSNHIRTGSNFDHRKHPAHSRAGPGYHYSSASHDLLSAILPSRASLVMQPPASASPLQTRFSTISRESQAEGRTSLETSQYEIVSAPKVHSNLTYPYLTSDHEHLDVYD
ncbi:hypothetical protein JVU11DRAFT_4762 [Chiua virens]|nr:hypothetical protein JVU11DRAFT_4762 [Chiua virens]